MAVLSGLRIVEFSAFVAAPLAGATLSSLGADVIRIEQRGGGIDAHRWPTHGERSLYRMGLDRGKRSVALDLRTERGQELATALVTSPGPEAGIFVTNLGGTGWSSYEKLIAKRNDLIMVHLSGTSDGRPAVDYTVNAEIGFPLVTGPKDWHRPVNHVLPAWDVSAGLLATIGVLAAERHRRITGEGQRVDLALADVALKIADHLGFIDEALLVEHDRPRIGNDLFGSYARDFRTSDGRDVVIIALTPRQWRSLVEATGLGAAFSAIEAQHGIDLSHEGERYRLRDEIGDLLEPWVAARTLDEVAATLDAHNVLWSPYKTFKEFVHDAPREVNRRERAVLQFAASAPAALPAAPPIGSDTISTLTEILGLSSTEISDLQTLGVID